MRVGILIDGSNLIGSLYRANLGYPALAPLLQHIRDGDDITLARFYGAPPIHEPWAGRWKSFMSANRHIDDLEFFQGYRHKMSNEEKAIDVALATDLLFGAFRNIFDRAVVIGGDGDHVYALKAARQLLPARVFLVDGATRGLAAAGIAFTMLRGADLVQLGICDPGRGTPVPILHRAPRTAAVRFRVHRGSNAPLPHEGLPPPQRKPPAIMHS